MSTPIPWNPNPIASVGNVQFGVVSATLNGAAGASGTINFSNAFGSAPVVQLTCLTTQSNPTLVCRLTAVPTTTQCFWAINTSNGAQVNATPAIYWIAIANS